MSIERMLATITEGSSWQIERLDGNLVSLPMADVAGTLGLISQEVGRRRNRTNAGLSTEFGLTLLVARCTASELAKRKASDKCAGLAWGFFWDEPGQKEARVTKATFERIGRVAVDDHCNPGHYFRLSDRAMSQELNVHHSTYPVRFKSVYGRLKTAISRAEYPVQEAFWRLLG